MRRRSSEATWTSASRPRKGDRGLDVVDVVWLLEGMAVAVGERVVPP